MKNELKFIINEEKRTVVAIATECELDALKLILKGDHPTHILSTLTDNIHCDCVAEDTFVVDETLLMPYSFSAKAKCHPEDTFDVAEGKRIAIKRLHKKYNKAKKKILSDYLAKINYFAANLEREIAKVDYKINK